jgi:hypothetical protein
MQGGRYRLEVEGELIDPGGVSFRGMTMRHNRGNTVLEGPVRDQAELHGVLQRVSDLGLTLLSLTALGRSDR